MHEPYERVMDEHEVVEGCDSTHLGVATPDDGANSTGEELAAAVAALLTRHPNRDGAAWLRDLHQLVEAAGSISPSRAMLLGLLDAALGADGASPEQSWPNITEPPQIDWLNPAPTPPPGEPDPEGHAFTLAVIRFQISDLNSMAAADQLQQVPLGVTSPTGNLWYNATSHDLLECGAAAVEDRGLPVQWGWHCLGELLELGRCYE